MSDASIEDERQRRELERDRSMIAHLRTVTKVIDLLESLPLDAALLALQAIHTAATGGAGPLASALSRGAAAALERIK